MMRATMAAKDTYQFTRTKASTTIITNTTLTPITTITTTNPINSSQRRQPFYQQTPAVTTTTLTTPTTAVQTVMGRAINIGFTGYTHAYINDHRAGVGEINEKALLDEVTGTRVTATAAAVVDIGIDVVDDDEGNVDGNGNVYTDSVAGMASAVVGDDVNFAVDSRKGMPTGGIEMDDGDDSDSFGSMETLSDNVAVWVDGEKHWVAGVDANTTCADLIGALLNYQNAQQLQQKQYQQQQHTFNVNSGKNNNNNNNNNSKTSSSTTNTAINQSMLIKTSTNTKENCDPLLAVSGELTIGGCFPAAPSLALTVPATSRAASIAGNGLTQACEYAIVKQHRHCEEYLDGNAKVFDVLPVNDSTTRKEYELLLRRLAAANSFNATTNGATFTALPAALQRSSSPSLNFNTQVSSLLSTDKDSGMGSPVGSSRSARLRRRKYKSATTVSWLAQANTVHPRFSQRAVAAFSGLGNTLTNAHGGNSNSKHIAVIEQAFGEDTLLALDGRDGLGGGANERLLKIILAQDETIHRQLALLREKERQISKIEEEKHRVRERELGKNYLLETYLKGLDEANVEPDLEACTDVGLAYSPVNEFNDVRFAHTAAVNCGDVVGNDNVEIYIDEPHQRIARTFKAHITPETTTPTTPTTTTKDIMLAKTKFFNLDARHSKKMKGDSTNGVEAVMTAGKIDGNESPNTSNHGNQKEIDVQLFWLEKIYALNKQMQREEEMLLKLHSKIRKHQVKRAYQTKREVLQQIEKLDAELTLQCCDIRAVENKLHASNEQLKQKLCVLERLSREFLETIETPTTDAAEWTTNSVAAVDADSQATVNRMPDVINNEDHNLVTLLRATEMARENTLQVADEWHAKQTTTEHLVMVQQSCQLQQLPEEPTDVWHMQDAKFRLPHAMQSAFQVLHTDLNIIGGENALVPTNTVAETITVPLPAAHTTTIQETTIVPKVVAASNAATILTETSCIATSSTPGATAVTIAIASPTATTTNMTSAITTAATSCNVSAVPPLAEGKQVTTLRLPQQQQQQLGQEQLLLPKPEDSARQCVDADDVLINVLAATSGVGVGLPQSNYPISCINHAAIHATSQLSTGQIIVAANADADGGAGGGGRVAMSMKLIAAEQKLTPATAAFPASNLASATSENTPQQQQEQLQQCHYQPELLPQRQQINLNVCMNDSCVSIQNNNNGKNLLPPSHAAYTKTLQKQMFGPKSLNQIQPAEPPPKIILVSTAAATMTTPSATMTTSPMHVGTHTGFATPPTITPLHRTTPAALLTSAVIPFNVTTTQCSSVDLTQLGTLV